MDGRTRRGRKDFPAVSIGGHSLNCLSFVNGLNGQRPLECWLQV
jgi:hypothetical protein